MPPRIYGEVCNKDGKIQLSIDEFRFDSLDKPPFEWIANCLLRKSSFFPESFYNESIAEAENLNLQQILSGWGIIVTLAEDIYSKLKDMNRSYDTLLKYSPYFLQSDLAIVRTVFGKQK